VFNYQTLNVYKTARELSSKNYYQVIYTNAKEIGLRIFENTIDLTEIQIYFLNYLNFYSNLNTDIALGDVNEIVRDNFIFEDAYTLFKYKNKKPKFSTTPETKPNKSGKETVRTTSQFVFRRKPDGE